MGNPVMGNPVMQVKALLFDTFGTVVDWRASVVRELSQLGAAQGVSADWAAFADRWRGQYQPQMARVRSGTRDWVKLDTLHRETLDQLLPEFGLAGLDEAQRQRLNTVWHRLKPWPDAVAGLTRLKRRFVIGPLSNGNLALLTHLAKHAGLPWDAILSTELTRSYKPQPQAYLGACALLDLAPAEVMMCAAHNDDLEAARALGLKTCFFARTTEHGPDQRTDLAPSQAWDVLASDIADLAQQLGA